MRTFQVSLRNLSALCVVFLCVLALSGCGENPSAPIPRTRSSSADLAPVWSHDGKTIAFYRRASSSLGPSGVYVVSSSGGTPRFVASEFIDWSTVGLRFSPDDRRLLSSSAGGLSVLDIATGLHEQLFQTEESIFSADWSPDGTRLAFALGSGFICEYNFPTHERRPIRPDSSVSTDSVYAGNAVRWSRDGSLAFVENHHTYQTISIIDADGTNRRVLTTSQDLQLFQMIHWYSRPLRGIEGVLFYQNTHPTAGSYFADASGSPVVRFPYRHGPHEAFSPDGEWVVNTDIDPVDSVGVLFVQHVDDLLGAARRQLTYWDP